MKRWDFWRKARRKEVLCYYKEGLHLEMHCRIRAVLDNGADGTGWFREAFLMAYLNRENTVDILTGIHFVFSLISLAEAYEFYGSGSENVSGYSGVLETVWKRYGQGEDSPYAG